MIASVQLSTSAADPTGLCKRLRSNYPHALFVVAHASTSVNPGRLHALGVDLVYPRVMATEYLPAMVVVARLHRRALIERRVHEKLCRRIASEFGREAAQSVGLTPPAMTAMTLDRWRSLSVQGALSWWPQPMGSGP